MGLGINRRPGVPSAKVFKPPAPWRSGLHDPHFARDSSRAPCPGFDWALEGPKMITRVRLNSYIFKGSEAWAATKKARYAFRFYKYFGQMCFYGGLLTRKLFNLGHAGRPAAHVPIPPQQVSTIL